MVAVIEALAALLPALMQALGLGYVAWKLESTGAADKIARGAGGAGDAVGGLANVPTGVLVVGGLALALVLLRR